MSTSTGSSELFVTAEFVDDLEISHFYSFRSDKHTTVGTTIKVAGSFDTTIILACRLVKSDAYPSTATGNFWDGSNELDCSAALE